MKETWVPMVIVNATALYPIPSPSMYGIFAYTWLSFMVNVGKYTIPMDPMGYMFII